MMNKAGLAALLGGRPRLGGLAHLAPGETRLPNQAMRADPSLRRHAMQSMARQGRNPSQYVAGGRNSINPRSGLAEFADMAYVNGQWVNPDTGAAVDFTGGNQFANSGFVENASSPTNPGYSPRGIDGAAIAHSLNLDPSVAYGNGTPEEIELFSNAVRGFTRDVVAPAKQEYDFSQPDTPVDFASDGRMLTVADMGPGWKPAGWGRPSDDGLKPIETTPITYAGTSNANAASDPADDFSSPGTSFDDFANPATYEAWRANRNPQGKGIQDQTFGQVAEQGTTMGLAALAQQGPNVLGTQIPAQSSQSWGIPGTALGQATTNNSDNPSILNSGYQQAGQMMGQFGVGMGPGWANQGGGISPGNGSWGDKNGPGRLPPNYAAAFNY